MSLVERQWRTCRQKMEQDRMQLHRLQEALERGSSLVGRESERHAECERRLHCSCAASSLAARPRLLRAERRLLELVAATTHARHRAEEAREHADELVASHARSRARLGGGDEREPAPPTSPTLAAATQRWRDLVALRDERLSGLLGTSLTDWHAGPLHAQAEMEALRLELLHLKQEEAAKSTELEEQKQALTHARRGLEVEHKRCDAVLRRLRGQLAEARSQRGQPPLRPHTTPL
ncbi:coiled-coil domain-containing protein 122 [Petromyzon marinus]|uniref:Coiled-coil domain-containing protein 122 n=1 Tax=Petromyzon marinus TaxID=7757 RepID=A0AAJ7XGB5_PETMA|nr:coiled-coil domain-containing protein 122 [Petromyzon marinus]XP_032833689.1 coiled-coil domain-containing protein 122 [Petromyzon marinus]